MTESCRQAVEAILARRTNPESPGKSFNYESREITAKEAERKESILSQASVTAGEYRVAGK